jgi:hypothetical protein
MHCYSSTEKSALQFEEQVLLFSVASYIYHFMNLGLTHIVFMTLRKHAYKYTDSCYGPIAFPMELKIYFYSNPYSE